MTTKYTVQTDLSTETTTDFAEALEWLRWEQGYVFARRYGRQQILAERTAIDWTPNRGNKNTQRELDAIRTANASLATPLELGRL